jgi:phosphohistidine phosphatase
MRHAKSPSGIEFVDHERPLTEGGVQDARLMGERLQKLGFEFQLVLCSDAQRTVSTWDSMAALFDPAITVVRSAALYASSPGDYFNEIRRLNFQGHTLLVIGHNPTIEAIIARLSGQHLAMAPAQLAVLELHATDWQSALQKEGLWTLVKQLT